jgi:type I restriction enzyme S subunit
MFLAKSNVGHKVCRPGDLVINTMWAWMAALGVTRHIGIVSPAYGVYRPSVGTGLQPSFAASLLRTPLYAAEYLRRSTGVNSSRLRLYPESFLRIPVLLPPSDEQAAIVRFLDHANGKIDRAIRAKRKLISLLGEQKQVIIHRAVTRGLDPVVKLKPSGIPWLGDVPEHWACTPIKRLLSRMDYGTSEVSKAEGRIRILTMGNIQRGEVIIPKSGGIDEISSEMLLDRHDILFTRTNGNPDLVGKVGLFRGERSDNVSFASYLVRLRAKPPHDPRWLHGVLNSSAFWSFARSHALVNLQTNLNSTRYSQFQIPVPPAREQSLIVAAIEDETAPLNVAIARTEREIALIREYRTTLAAEVVTGKLDVREAAKRLPAVTEESLLVDDPRDNDVSDDAPDEADL